MENKNDKKDQFVELRAKGNSYDSIAKKIGVSKGTLISWSRDLKVEIQNYRNLEADALMEKYKMTKNSQLESLGAQLTKVREEVSKRDLSDIPTEKLVTMEIKLLETINNSEASSTILSADDPWESKIESIKSWSA